MTTTAPLLLPVRVMACALDPDALPDTLDTTDKPTPFKWSWSAPDYGGFKSGSATPLSSVWPTLFNTPAGGGGSAAEINVPPSLSSRAPGVCVSWSLPAGWARPLDPKDVRSLPAIPDRWLVVRFSRRAGAPAEPPKARAWVVDSGVLIDERSTSPHDLQSARVLVEGEVSAGPRRVGAVRSVKDACDASATERRVRLTTQGSEAAPDFTFAAFAPANLNNLSFIDPLDDLLNAQRDASSELYGARLSYLVVGWYRDARADDPLRRFASGEGEKSALRSLGLDPVQRLIERSPEGMTDEAARAALGLTASSPLAPGDTAVFHGLVANVDYFDRGGYFGPVFGSPNAKCANGADGFVDTTQPEVGFGETAEEALSRLASKINPEEDESRQLATVSSRLIDALLTDEWRYWDSLGGVEAGAKARRASTFRTSPGGSEWEAVPNDKKADDKKALPAAADVKVDAPSLSPEQRRALFTLNEAQQALDSAEAATLSAAETLYAAWWTLQADASPADSPRRALLAEFVRRYQKRVEELKAAEASQRKSVSDSSAALRAQVEASTAGRLTLRNVTGARFFMPKEPAVALRDIGARAPGAAIETPWRKAASARVRRKGEAAEPETAWLDPALRATDDEALRDALREVAREAVAVEQLVAGAVAHHTDAGSTRRHYDVWRKRALGVSRDLPGAAMDPPRSKDKTPLRADSFAGELTDQDAKPVALRELATVWTHQPWMPLFLDWEVEWFYDGDGFTRSVTLRGRTLLAHRPQSVIRSRYKALAGRPDLGVRVRTALADCDIAIQEVLKTDIVAQSLSGLHQQLTLRDDALPRVLPSKGDGGFRGLDALLERTTNAPAAAGTEFTPFRGGSLVVRRLWVVDRFGQAYALNAPRLSVPASALHTPRSFRVKVQPRALEPLRLVVQPRMPAGSTTVVRGWVLPNLLEASLTVYDAEGAPLGIIAAADRVRWSPAQSAAPATPAEVADPCLRAFVERLVHAPGELASPKSERFEALKQSLDDALSRTWPGGSDASASVASILGRPLALVRARVGIERRGGPIVDPNCLRSDSWLRMSPTEFDDAVLDRLRAQPPRSASITLGARYIPDDGLVGYYAVGSDRGDDSAQLELTAKTLGEKAPKLTLPLPRAESMSTRTLDLLLDPRGRVHLEGDIVPGTAFALSPQWYEETLRRLPAVMRVTSALVDSAAPFAPDVKPADRGRMRLPLPAATQSRGGDAPRSDATLSSGGIDFGVDPVAQIGAVEPGEAAVVDGVLAVGALRKPSSERAVDERPSKASAVQVARAAPERRVVASGEAIELPVSLSGAMFTLKAKTDWLEYNGRNELFLSVTVSSTGAPAPSAASLGLVLPTEWKPGDVFVGSGPGCVGLADNAQCPWKIDASVISDWEVNLTRLNLSGDGSKQPSKGAVAQGEWYLSAAVLLRQSKKSGAVPVALSINGCAPVTVELQVAAPKAASYVVKLLSDTADTSALKYGSSFKLSWELARVVSADLWGPLTDDGSNHVTLYPAQGTTPSDDAVITGSKSIVVMGPMNFTLRAKVKVGARVEEVVRSVTAGVLTDPRGGRLDVWPRQVLPRGPIAARWSAYKVTEFKFHSITGDVLDEESDGPAIGTDLYEYRPSDSGWATTVQGVPFTIGYGPRPGQDWTVEAECEPEGDARLLQCRVSAIGTRKLASSLSDGDSANAQWSYLAVGALPPEKDTPTRTPTATLPPVDSKSVVAIAAGRFPVNEKDGPERWREWIAVASKERLDLHINKLFDQRSYLVNHSLHPKIEWLKGVLEGPVLGVGAADIAWQTAKPASADGAGRSQGAAVFVLRGENVVVVRKGKEADEVVITEFRLPLEASRKPVSLTFKSDGWNKLERVRVVSLWPRVYVFGPGVCFSYDRTDPDATKWKPEREPRLARVASPEWEIVGIPRPRAPGVEGAPRGGYLFALAKTTGRLWRFELRDSEVIDSRFIEMASANGQVALLHDLQSAQGDYTFKSSMDDGRILLGRDEEHNQTWRNPINKDSVLLVIGGALVARSEVHDPVVQPVYSRGEKGRERRGIQDRAYNPRLNLWVRCGHPFFHACTRDGAFFDSTSRSLYCRTPDGEITYISPIEPSHLGFLAVDLAPRTDGFVATSAMVFDTLLAGQDLTKDECLESKNKAFRLTYTEGGDLVLHRANDPATALWKLATRDGAKGSASLGFDCNLSLRDAKDALIASAIEHEVTIGTKLREMPEAQRRDYTEKRLVVNDEGQLLCLAKRTPKDDDEVIWGAPSRCTGDTLLAGQGLAPWEYLESADKKHRLEFRRWVPTLVRVADQKTLWAPDVSVAVHKLRLDAGGRLVCLDANGQVAWTNDTWGAYVVSSDVSRMVLDTSGALVIRNAQNQERWRTDQAMGDTLQAGQAMSPGSYLEAPGKQCRLVFQRDGNVVLYRRDGGVLWSSSSWQATVDSVTLGDGGLDGGALLLKSNGSVVRRLDGFAQGPHYTRTLLRVHDGGVRVGSAYGDPWWAIETASLPSHGAVRQLNTGRYKLFNHHKNGYLFGAENGYTEWHRTEQRHVGVERNGGVNFATNVWVLARIEGNRYTIRNEVQRTYLRVGDDGNCYDSERRYVVTTPIERVAEAPDFALFELSMDDQGTIRSVAVGEYIYAAEYDAWYDGKRCRVLGWRKKELHADATWRFVSV